MCLGNLSSEARKIYIHDNFQLNIYYILYEYYYKNVKFISNSHLFDHGDHGCTMFWFQNYSNFKLSTILQYCLK